ncbi:MAG: hypothetical protein MZV63_29405, partial [Marinilabiliales bacterium]|nr:hypothetical protein [Marinilabiliales bacterium]
LRIAKVNLVTGTQDSTPINYIVNCKEQKVAVASFRSETGEGKIESELADFTRAGDYLCPGSSQIMDSRKQICNKD